MASKFAVIGLGRFGNKIARTLALKGAEVMAIDSDLEKVEEIKEDVAYAVAFDSTDRRAVEAHDVQKMDAVVVAIGENFEGLLLTSALLKDLKVKFIWIKAHNGHEENERCDDLAKMAASNPEFIDTEYEINSGFAPKETENAEGFSGEEVPLIEEEPIEEEDGNTEEANLEEDIVVDQKENIEAAKSLKIKFKVQLGEYTDGVPVDEAGLYLKLTSRGIKNYTEDAKTIYIIGSFRDYNSAVDLQSEMKEMGVKNPKVVAFQKNKPIDVNIALEQIENN